MARQKCPRIGMKVAMVGRVVKADVGLKHPRTCDKSVVYVEWKSAPGQVVAIPRKQLRQSTKQLLVRLTPAQLPAVTAVTPSPEFVPGPNEVDQRSQFEGATVALEDVRYAPTGERAAMGATRHDWEPHIDSEPEEERGEEPEEDDIITTDHHKWYQSGKLYFTGTPAALKKKMDQDKFWPDVWFISDHGNAHRTSLSGATIALEGVGATYTQHPQPYGPAARGEWVVVDTRSGTTQYHVFTTRREAEVWNAKHKAGFVQHASSLGGATVALEGVGASDQTPASDYYKKLDTDQWLGKRTYAQAQQMLQEGLRNDGWSVQTSLRGRPLKIPHATSPAGHIKLWFKAQSIYWSRGNQSFAHARTLTYADIRGMTYEHLRATVAHLGE